ELGPNRRHEKLQAIVGSKVLDDFRRDRPDVEAPALTTSVIQEHRRIDAAAIVVDRHHHRVRRNHRLNQIAIIEETQLQVLWPVEMLDRPRSYKAFPRHECDYRGCEYWAQPGRRQPAISVAVEDRRCSHAEEQRQRRKYRHLMELVPV